MGVGRTTREEIIKWNQMTVMGQRRPDGCWHGNWYCTGEVEEEEELK